MAESKPPDPFNPDVTIMIPRPGGRSAPPVSTTRAHAVDATGAFAAPSINDEAVFQEISGPSPLVAAASVLLQLIPHIRSTLSHPDPAGLHKHLLRAIADFEQRARSAGIPPETVTIARYALCTALDEAIASTPWGGTAALARESLLVTLHHEAAGGERFFHILDKAKDNPRQNLGLIELLYMCLALGFEGRYRVAPNGRSKLGELRGGIYQIIRQQRGDFERELSPQWQGLARARGDGIRRVPPWAIFSAFAFVLFGVFLTLIVLLNKASDPAFTALMAMHADTGSARRVAAPLVAPRLRDYLANEIDRGLLDLDEDAEISRLVIRGDSLFAIGSTDPNETLLPVIARVAQALDQVAGTVIVTGHTDNQPIRSLRFPSNYQLSLARANAIAHLIRTALHEPGRVRAEGMADSQPLEANDTPDGRARNRRVEILLRAAE